MDRKKSQDELRKFLSAARSTPELITMVGQEMLRLTKPNTALENWEEIEEKFPGAVFVHQHQEGKMMALRELKSAAFNRVIELED